MKNKPVLSNDELSQLIGGIVRLNELAVVDVSNLNSEDYCGCTYNNSSAISNTNTADKCSCVCR